MHNERIGDRSLSLVTRLGAMGALALLVCCIDARAQGLYDDSKTKSEQPSATSRAVEGFVATPEQLDVDPAEIRKMADQLLEDATGFDSGTIPYYVNIWNATVDAVANDLTEFSMAVKQEEPTDSDPIIAAMRRIAGPPPVLESRDNAARQFYEKISQSADSLRNAIAAPLPCAPPPVDPPTERSVCAAAPGRYPKGSTVAGNHCCSREPNGFMCMTTCSVGTCTANGYCVYIEP